VNYSVDEKLGKISKIVEIKHTVNPKGMGESVNKIGRNWVFEGKSLYFSEQANTVLYIRKNIVYYS
jgi:hypothetical protein